MHSLFNGFFLFWKVVENFSFLFLLTLPTLFVIIFCIPHVPLQATSDSRNIETEAFFVEEKNSGDLDQLVQDLEHQFLHWPDLWNL